MSGDWFSSTAADTDRHYRVHGKYFDFDHTSLANGDTVNDAWHKSQAGFRADWDRIVNSDFVAFPPANADQEWSGLFAQDEIALHADVRLTLGARLERNDYTDNEFLPNARLAREFTRDNLLWTAASKCGPPGRRRPTGA